MAEVRSKMSDVKSQVMEVRGAEPRPGTSGSLAGGELPSQHGDSKHGELELLDRGATVAVAAARSRPCRHGKLHLLSLFTFRCAVYWRGTATRQHVASSIKEHRASDCNEEMLSLSSVAVCSFFVHNSQSLANKE